MAAFGVILGSMEIENFLSFGAKQTLDLRRRGLLLIEGSNCDEPVADSNGSGKSALGEALVWGLFGRTMRGLRGDDVVHERAEGPCSVRIAGEHDQPFEVVRSRGRGLCPLQFRVDGVDHTAGNDSTETQRRIEKFLGCTAEVFCQTVVFGQGAAWRFSQLSDNERKALLDKLLGLERIGRAHESAKAKLADVSILLANFEAEHAIAKQRRHDTYVMWRELRAARKRYDDRERETWQTEVNRLQQEYEALPKVPPQVVEARFSDQLEVVRLARAHRDKLSGQLMRAKAASRVATRDREDGNRRLQRLRSLSVGRACDACGMPMDAKHLMQWRANVKVELDALDAVCIEAAKKAVRRGDKAEIAQKDLQVAEADLAAIEQERARENLERAKLLHERLHVERALARANEQLATRRKPSVSDEEKQAKVSWRAAKAHVKERRGQIAAAKELCAHWQFWVEGFGPAGVRSHLLDHVMPVLNHHAAQFAQKLTQNLKVEFATQATLKGGGLRDKLTVHVSNPTGGSRYEATSTGERRKVDIVVALALQALVQGPRRCNVAIWDEVFEGLDETSSEAVMELLRDQAQTRTLTLVISHAAWLKAHFPHALCVEKRDGFSRLILG